MSDNDRPLYPKEPGRFHRCKECQGLFYEEHFPTKPDGTKSPICVHCLARKKKQQSDDAAEDESGDTQ